MKKLNQHLLLAAAMMLMAGSAYAQAGGPGPKPTNTYTGAPVRSVGTPTNTHEAYANREVSGASAGTPSRTYSDYSQDSYVSQTGSTNYAKVDQSNTSGSALYGSTAVIDQTGSGNNAKQTQTSTGNGFNGQPYGYNGSATSPYNRNFAKATQAGSNSQSDQTQVNGVANVMTVVQGENTTGNRAIQTQGDASTGNQAAIAQTKYAVTGGGSGNRAEQLQTGANQIAKIEQESISSYAKQTQTGSGAVNDNNSAYIHQGDPGTSNTAIQSQSGTNGTARIQQGIGGTTNSSYAMQTQSGDNNQADISQFNTNGSYAEQMQSNSSNYSGITQSNVRSAAYSVQSGAANAAIITQH
jgi:hypothetical protein